MRLNAGQVEAQIKRGLAPCYVLAGEEPLLIQEAQDAIRVAAREQGYAERETLDVERDFDWNRLLELCATGSLFCDRRLIELRVNTAPGDAGGKVLKQLAATPPAGVLLMVVAGKLETRVRNSGWYAALEQAGAGLYAWPMRGDEFPRWLGQRLRAAGLQADADALALLVQRTEGNLLAAAQEVTKLALLHAGEVLDTARIVAAVTDTAHYGVFDWIDRMLAGDCLAAARGLVRLREEGEALPALVAVLAMDLRKLAQAAARGGGESALTAAGVFKMRQGAFARALSRVRPGQVLGWLQQLSQVDILLKTGADSAAWEGLTRVVLAVSGLRRRRAG